MSEEMKNLIDHCEVQCDRYKQTKEHSFYKEHKLVLDIIKESKAHKEKEDKIISFINSQPFADSFERNDNYEATLKTIKQILDGSDE